MDIYQRFGRTCCLHLQDTRMSENKCSRLLPSVVNIYKTTRRHVPKESILHFTKSFNTKYFFYLLL
jgi:hypothetical protein